MEYFKFEFKFSLDIIRELVEQAFPNRKYTDNELRAIASRINTEGYWELVERDIKEVSQQWLSDRKSHKEEILEIEHFNNLKAFDGDCSLDLEQFKKKLGDEKYQQMDDEELFKLAEHTSYKMGWDGIQEDIDNAINFFSEEWLNERKKMEAFT
ncbi:MAG: hypothetical protein ACXAC2_00300 [Candidatus Kariarchaeaceae archaeon]